MALPDLWRLFNLRASPFFQDTLQPTADDTSPGRFPLDLFVGRERESQRLLGGMGGGASSRQVIQGSPGIGKTTLAQHVKALAARERLISQPDAVWLSHADSADVVLVRILSYVYEAILANGDSTTAGLEPMATARQIVRTYRVRGGGVTIGAPAIGSIGGSISTTHITPATSLPVMVPRLLTQLAEFARTHCGAQGVLIHLNNLENLTATELDAAAAVIRDIRDTALMVPGYHFVVVGTTDAVSTLIGAQAQVRSVFTVSTPLAPLPLSDVRTLLARRYEYLRLDTKRPATPPVTDEAVAFLYEAFHGDLRGMLRALDAAAHDLIGYGAQAAAPMSVSDLAAVLKEHYREEMVGSLPEKTRDFLVDVDSHFGGTPFSQRDVVTALGRAQGTVSNHLQQLIKHGYVLGAGQRPATRRPETLYRLTGPGRLVFGGTAGSLPDVPRPRRGRGSSPPDRARRPRRGR